MTILEFLSVACIAFLLVQMFNFMFEVEIKTGKETQTTDTCPPHDWQEVIEESSGNLTYQCSKCTKTCANDV